MTNKPKISVIIPVYNSEKYIEKCINSITKQTLKEIEIIVINDGSTDKSSKIIDKLVNNDNRIKVIHKKNEGISITRNLGIDIARGEFISFVDSDDYIDNIYAYEKLYNRFLETNAEVVLGNFNFVTDNKEEWSYFPGYFFYNKHNFDSIGFLKEKSHLLNLLTQGIWNKIYSKKFLDKNKLRFIEKINFEDTPFSISISLLCNKIAVISDVVYNYFIGNPQSFSRKLKGKEQLEFIKVSVITKKFLKKQKIYEKYFKYLIWLFLPIDKYKNIKPEFKKIFYKELYKYLDFQDYELINKFGNEEQVKFSKLLQLNNFEKYLLFEKFEIFKNKTKNIIKKTLCKINPIFRNTSRVVDGLKILENKFNLIIDKNFEFNNILKQIIEKQSQIEKKFLKYNKHLKVINNEKNESIINNQNLSIKKIDYLENLIKISTDITKIPKATGVLRKIQEAELLILNRIDTICKKYNIKYWLDYGTLLGAIRHKGFIPWDDDIDISMMRSDYEKFFSILKKEFENTKYHFVRSEIIRIYYSDIPLRIDIYQWDLYYKKIDVKNKKIIFDEISKQQQKIKYNYENLNKYENIITNLSYDEICNLKNKFILKGNIPNIKNKPSIFRALEIPGSRGDISEIYNYDYIFPLKKIRFENLKLYCPNKYQKIINEKYNNPFSFPNNLCPEHNDIKERIDNNTIDKIDNFILINKNV